VHVGRILHKLLKNQETVSILGESEASINLKINMNFYKINQMAKVGVVALSVGFVGFAASSAQAGELITGLEYNANTIFTINSSTPGSIFATGVSGLQGGDILVGVDYLGSILYGVGNGGNLYTINASLGAASLVNHFGTLNGTYYGVDASSAGIRIVSDNEINILLNPTTGAVISSGPSLTSGLTIDAIASSGSAMYGVDSLANTLGILNTATGAFATIGSMGYDVSGNNGFDISPNSGTAYFASNVSGANAGTDANLYQVNLATGFASLVGQIGPGGVSVAGLTVQAVPEPSSIALVCLGGAGMVGLMRRRK
jgi:hypothetical protein